MELDEELWIDYPHELADLVDPNDPDQSLIREKSSLVHEILRTPSFPPQEISLGKPYAYATAKDLLFDSMRLGVNIARSGYVPDFIVALWPGGVQSGLVIH